MLKEYEQVVLTVDLPQFALQVGDVGTIVDISPSGQQITVEFFNFMGETVALAPLKPEQIRTLDPQEVMHARLVKLDN